MTESGWEGAVEELSRKRGRQAGRQEKLSLPSGPNTGASWGDGKRWKLSFIQATEEEERSRRDHDLGKCC